jgi:hypothetical protein
MRVGFLFAIACLLSCNIESTGAATIHLANADFGDQDRKAGDGSLHRLPLLASFRDWH